MRELMKRLERIEAQHAGATMTDHHHRRVVGLIAERCRELMGDDDAPPCAEADALMDSIRAAFGP